MPDIGNNIVRYKMLFGVVRILRIITLDSRNNSVMPKLKIRNSE